MNCLSLAAAFVIAATPVLSDVVSYDCALKGWENKGWIPERVLFSVEAEKGNARVYDGLVEHAKGRPIAADIKSLKSGKYRLNWKLNLPSDGAGDIRVNYTATIDPSSLTFNLRAKFPMVNASNNPRGDGRCQIMKGKTLF
ncbi:hypothetical protein [Parasedimentitalea huanghaiensis]|uniref:Uncharacterized protein n=1 Tax=Parasedimentitalea huanghaiensis TaxID=2682100 RepID=A0A6L6WB29_9RHOB|nr:hypothetical protein [Zongyanglinia huanghaiensis]MVO14884.1 hypothetical protein [Zongyanglinia huanghaiensis]